MHTEKDRRHSGRKFAPLTIPSKIAREEEIDPVEYWDDWDDRRDGMRDLASDRTRFGVVKPFMEGRTPFVRTNNKMRDMPMAERVRMNNGKLLRQEHIREARREMKKRK